MARGPTITAVGPDGVPGGSAEEVARATFRQLGEQVVIKNFGESIAHDVRVDIVGLPEWVAADSVLSALWDRYQRPIPTLVPELELGNSFAALPEVAENPPNRITVNISYADDEGRSYSDSFELDAELIRGETWSQQTKR